MMGHRRELGVGERAGDDMRVEHAPRSIAEPRATCADEEQPREHPRRRGPHPWVGKTSRYGGHPRRNSRLPHARGRRPRPAAVRGGLQVTPAQAAGVTETLYDMDWIVVQRP